MLLASQHYEAGENYYYGRNGFKKSYVCAEQCYRDALAIDPAHASANYAFGYIQAYLAERTNMVLAISHFQKAAQSGHVHSIAELEKLLASDAISSGDALKIARLYDGAPGITLDHVKEKKWYEKAVINHENVAYFNLAIMYKLGQAVPINLVTAAKYYALAMKYGHSSGARDALTAITQSAHATGDELNNIGSMFYDGSDGVNKDYQMAKVFFEAAITNGSQRAYGNLGLIYQYGFDVPRNVHAAAILYRRGVIAGSERCQTHLDDLLACKNTAGYELCYVGTMYYNGDGGIPIDYARAVLWLTRATQKESKEAYLVLSKIYATGGYGVQQDLQLSEKCRQKSIDARDTSAYAIVNATLTLGSVALKVNSLFSAAFGLAIRPVRRFLAANVSETAAQAADVAQYALAAYVIGPGGFATNFAISYVAAKAGNKVLGYFEVNAQTAGILCALIDNRYVVQHVAGTTIPTFIRTMQLPSPSPSPSPAAANAAVTDSNTSNKPKQPRGILRKFEKNVIRPVIKTALKEGVGFNVKTNGQVTTLSGQVGPNSFHISSSQLSSNPTSMTSSSSTSMCSVPQLAPDSIQTALVKPSAVVSQQKPSFWVPPRAPSQHSVIPKSKQGAVPTNLPQPKRASTAEEKDKKTTPEVPLSLRDKMVLMNDNRKLVLDQTNFTTGPEAKQKLETYKPQTVLGACTDEMIPSAIKATVKSLVMRKQSQEHYVNPKDLAKDIAKKATKGAAIGCAKGAAIELGTRAMDQMGSSSISPMPRG